MPTGKPSEIPTPQSIAPANASGVLGPNTNSSRPATAIDGERADDRHAPVAVEQPGPEPAADGHRGQEGGEGERADRGGRAVVVDQRDADPVVARALGEGEREHEHADQQRARLAPGRERRRAPGAASARPRRRRGRGGSARTASGTPIATATPTTRRCAVTGTSERDHRRADQRAGDRAEAEPGVEARHDRAAEALLDERALDVHRDVPGAVAEAEQEQADDDRGDADPVARRATTISPAPREHATSPATVRREPKR